MREEKLQKERSGLYEVISVSKDRHLKMINQVMSHFWGDISLPSLCPCSLSSPTQHPNRKECTENKEKIPPSSCDVSHSYRLPIGNHKIIKIFNAHLSTPLLYQEAQRAQFWVRFRWCLYYSLRPPRLLHFQDRLRHGSLVVARLLRSVLSRLQPRLLWHV
jgi:hypothetical protein